MIENYQVASCIAILAAFGASVWVWLVFPSYRCPAFAAGSFVLALPFYLSLLDTSPHGHPDLRSVAFMFISGPLLLIGVASSIVGLLRRSQHRKACVFTLFLGVAFLLSSLIFIPR